MLEILLAGALLSCANVPAIEAHSIQVDGSAADWFAVTTPTTNLGRLARRSDGGGEYVWRDAVGDARSAWPSWPHDLTQFRVTADSQNLYLCARIDGTVPTHGAGTPQLRVAIDLDRFFYSGGTSLGDSAICDVSPAGAYEALLVTRFATGSTPQLFDAYGGERTPVAQAVLSSTGVVEVAIPWAALGLASPPHQPLRLAAALFVSNADDVPLDPGDGVAARAADVVTQNGAPGTSGTTATELADYSLDYTFDVWFDMYGDVVSPAVINELYVDSGANSAWIEVVNVAQELVVLGNYKLGDAASPGDNDSMAQFPSGTLLLPGEGFAVARNGATFLAEQGHRAGAECVSSDAGTPDMLPFPAWATSTIFNIPNGGDHVVLLDGSNTVVDVVAFKNGTYPGVIAHPGAANLHSLDRRNPGVDTDDCSDDFLDQPAPSPGLCIAITAVTPDVRPMHWSPPAPNPVRGSVRLALDLATPTAVRVDVIDAAGRRVRTLWDAPASAGTLRLGWDARDERGAAVAPGLYFVRAAASGTFQTLRMAVIR